MRFFMVVTAALAFTASSASAQTLPSRWDTAVVTGFYFGRPGDIADAEHHDQWFNTGQVALTAGWYWTPHLKTEAELSLTGEGGRYATRFLEVPGAPAGRLTAVGVEQHTSTRAVAATLAWQFLDNQWVHPYVLGGAALDVDRSRIETFNPFSPQTSSETTTVVRGIVGAGAKAYFTTRGFVRAEARAGIGDKTSHLSFRAGVGVDF